MRNYTLTGDQDQARLINTLAAVGIGLNDIGASGAPGAPAPIVGRGARDPNAALYEALTSRLTKDFTPISSQGRPISRAQDPMEAIASLQNDEGFTSLPPEYQEKVLETRGGAGASQAVKTMRQLQYARATAAERARMRAEASAQTDMQGPRRMLKRMFDSGDLMVEPEKGLLQRSKDPMTGDEKWIQANPWILGWAEQEMPNLGFGQAPLNPAQRLALQISRANPKLSTPQVQAMVNQKLKEPASASTPPAAEKPVSDVMGLWHRQIQGERGVLDVGNPAAVGKFNEQAAAYHAALNEDRASAAARNPAAQTAATTRVLRAHRATKRPMPNVPVEASAFDPTTFGREVIAGQAIPAVTGAISKAGEFRDAIPPFVMSLIRNAATHGANAGAGAINMGAGLLGAKEDVVPYLPFTDPSRETEALPDWLLKANKLVAPFP